MPGHNDLDIQVFISVISQDFRNFTFRFPVFFGPAGNPDQHSGAASGIQSLIQRDINIFPQPFIVGDDKPTVLLPVIGADDGRIGPFDNADDFPFLPVSAAALQQPDLHFIIIHGRMTVRFGDVNIFFQVISDDEPEIFRISFINTCNFRTFLCCQVSLASDSHKHTTPCQFIKNRKQLCQLSAFQIKLLGTIFNSGTFFSLTTYIYYIMSELFIHYLLQ